MLSCPSVAITHCQQHWDLKETALCLYEQEGEFHLDETSCSNPSPGILADLILKKVLKSYCILFDYILNSFSKA